MAARALCEFPDDLEKFARRLGGYFRWWLLGVPAGIGLATLKAILRLWCGVPASRSGVNSAGNGAAMRSAILGAAIDIHSYNRFANTSARITHTDRRATYGAYLIAWAALNAKQGRDDFNVFFAALADRKNCGRPNRIRYPSCADR